MKWVYIRDGEFDLRTHEAALFGHESPLPQVYNNRISRTHDACCESVLDGQQHVSQLQVCFQSGHVKCKPPVAHCGPVAPREAAFLDVKADGPAAKTVSYDGKILSATLGCLLATCPLQCSRSTFYRDAVFAVAFCKSTWVAQACRNWGM